MAFQSNWKPSRTARKIEERKTKLSRRRDEDNAKRDARKRDRACRFPMCGCKRLGLPLEVSHDEHKGMGGNPAGDRSTPEKLVLLCNHRHQFGRISRHAGTMKAMPHSSVQGYNGPVSWYVRRDEIPDEVVPAALFGQEWVCVADEVSPGRLAQPMPWQLVILKRLAEMDV